MSTGLSSLKASEDALNQGNLSTISTATSRTIGCPICSSLVGANIAKNHLLSWNNSEKKCIVCGKNCGKPALLDLFSGAGGAARGYQRAGFCVLGVDIKPQPHYAGCRFVQADAMTYPLDGFDAIHASPPCQGYSITKSIHGGSCAPLLVGAVRNLLLKNKRPFVIENVVGAPMKNPIRLRGNMFGLRVIRDRLFEIHPFLILTPKPVPPKGTTNSHRGMSTGGEYITVAGHNFRVREAADAMGIDWMSQAELAQAIPPAYTEWIGRQLMDYLNAIARQACGMEAI